MGRNVVVHGGFVHFSYGVTASEGYPDICISETIDITRVQLLKHNSPEMTTQICRILETILQQNYLITQEQIYQPDKGIAMGSPISGTIAEIFLQYLEHTHIKPS